MANNMPSKRAFVLGVIFAVILLCATILPGFWPVDNGRRTSPLNACINNLREIDGAKELWALENHKEDSAESIVSEVDRYIKGGHPKCPSGGKYKYGKVSDSPRCSVQGHVLPLLP